MIVMGKSISQIWVKISHPFFRNGASKSGLFCACSLVFERMRVDHEVDIYQTVKQIRINRPHFVENIVSLTALKLYKCFMGHRQAV